VIVAGLRIVTMLADLRLALEEHVSASQSIHKSNRGRLHLLNILVNASLSGSITSPLLSLFDSGLGYKHLLTIALEAGVP